MSKLEEIKDMMNNDNAPVIAGIVGIVALVGIDRITKASYKVDASKDSITLAPAGEAEKPQPQGQEKDQ